MLDALEHLTDPNISREFERAVFTERSIPSDPDLPILSGLFELDQGDLEALEEVPGDWAGGLSSFTRHS